MTKSKVEYSCIETELCLESVAVIEKRCYKPKPVTSFEARGL